MKFEELKRFRINETIISWAKDGKEARERAEIAGIKVKSLKQADLKI